MRDPNRIDRMTSKLRRLWHLKPDWRLGQMVDNMKGVAGPQCFTTTVFSVEDDRMEQAIDAALAEAGKV